MSDYLILSESTFKSEVLQSELPVLVDFWAEWCMPCKIIAPIVEDIAREFKDQIKVGKVNVDQNPQISMNFSIRSIPTLLIFKNGIAVEQIIGAVPKKTIIEKLRTHL